MGPLRTNRAALAAPPGGAVRRRFLDASQVCCGLGDLRTHIAGIDTVLAEAAQTSPLADLALTADDDTTLIDHWQAASPDIKGKVIAELMDVVVMPAPRGRRDFDPDLIEIRWH